jgi:L-lysine 2,3-aminomutase
MSEKAIFGLKSLETRKLGCMVPVYYCAWVCVFCFRLKLVLITGKSFTGNYR